MPNEGEHRIPAWALDPKLNGAPTATLLAAAEDADEWLVYHFMSTPNGSLNGLRPFECLLSEPPSTTLKARAELVSHLGLPAKASLLDVVAKALAADIAEGQEA